MSEEKKKFNFRQVGVYLGMIGSAVGFGNMWRFPEQAAKFGGLAYILIYIICSTIAAWPMVCLEVFLGQLSRGSLFDAGRLANAKWYSLLGASVISVFGLFSFYSTLLMWVANYLIHSGSQPWYPSQDAIDYCGALAEDVCNVTSCVEAETDLAADWCQCSWVVSDVSDGACSVDFFAYAGSYFGTVANENPNWIDPTKIGSYTGAIEAHNWTNYGIFCVNAVLAIACVLFGDKVLSYIMYCTMGPTILILLGLFIYSMTLPNAGAGLKEYVGVFDATELYSIDVWKGAVNQSVFSCSLGSFLIASLSSMNEFSDTIGSSCMLIVVADAGFALISGFIVFSMLGYLSQVSGATVLALLGSGGGGLIFITYSSGISQLLGGGSGAAAFHVFFWVLFYLMGFTSYVTMAKSILSFVLDTKLVTGLNGEMIHRDAKPGKWSYIVAGIMGVSAILLGLINAGDWGSYLIDLIDYYVSGLLLPLTIGLTCLVFGWCMNTEWYNENCGRKTTMISRIAFAVVIVLPGIIRFTDDSDSTGGIIFLICAFVAPSVILLCASYATSKSKGISYGEACGRNFNGYLGVCFTRHNEYINHEKKRSCGGGGLFPWVAGLIRALCSSLLLCLASDSLGKPNFFFNFSIKFWPENTISPDGVDISGLPVPLPTWVAFVTYFFPFAFMFVAFICSFYPDAIEKILSTRADCNRGLLVKNEYAFGLLNDNDVESGAGSSSSSSSSSTESSSDAGEKVAHEENRSSSSD